MCFSTLVNLFLYDIRLPRAGKSRCPSRADLVAQVFPQLEELQATVLREVAAGISGAINTATTISPAGATSTDGNPAVGNSTAADISAARDSAAAGIFAGINTAGISAAGISDAVVGDSSGGGKSSGVGELVGSAAAEDEVAATVNMDDLKLSDGDDDDVMEIGQNGSSCDDQHKKSLINLSKTRQSLATFIAVYHRCVLVSTRISETPV